jgi:aminoglycoside phosphotransferase (APT) family kinase protein
VGRLPELYGKSMKINSSDLYLSLIQGVFETTITPELSSETAQTSAAILQCCFAELQRREQQSPAILAKANNDGLSIVTDMQSTLENHGRPALKLDKIDLYSADEKTFTALAEQNADITEQLTVLSRALGSIPPKERNDGVNSLLQRAGQWEYQLHVDQLQATSKQQQAETKAEPLPQAALEAFIQSVHPDGKHAKLLSMERAEGGSGKQTFFISVADASGDIQNLVVRKADKTPMMTTGAYLIEREYKILTIVANAGYLAPKPLWLGQNVAGTDGGDFFIMERLPGKIPGTFLGGADEIPESFILRLPELLAQLHNIDIDLFSDYIKEYESTSLLNETIEECTHRTVAEWREYAVTANQLSSPAHEYMLDWLSRNVPANKGKPVLLHGDFNIHNILMHEGKVSTVLDWEGAMFGAPELDLAYIRPHISKHIDWDIFVARYQQAGGKPIDQQAFDYYQSVLAMRVMNGLCSSTKNLQDRTTNDIRLCMVQLGYVLEFMRLGLEVCKES